MSEADLAEIASKFLLPSVAVGVGTLAGCLVLPREGAGLQARSSALRVARELFGAALIGGGFIAGILLAARGVLGAVPAFVPQIEAQWQVWAGVLGTVVGVLACVLGRRATRASAHGPSGEGRGGWLSMLAMGVLALGALVVGVLEVRLGLAAASTRQFWGGPGGPLASSSSEMASSTSISWWLNAAVVVLGVSMGWVMLAFAAMRAERPNGASAPQASVRASSPRAGAWALLPALACMGPSLAYFFYARSSTMTELGAAGAGMLTAALVALLIAPRVGVAPMAISASIALWSTGVWGARYYAEGPALATYLVLAGPILAGALMLALQRRPRIGRWAWLIASLAAAALVLVGSLLARQANARPDDLYGGTMTNGQPRHASVIIAA